MPVLHLTPALRSASSCGSVWLQGVEQSVSLSSLCLQPWLIHQRQPHHRLRAAYRSPLWPGLQWRRCWRSWRSSREPCRSSPREHITALPKSWCLWDDSSIHFFLCQTGEVKYFHCSTKVFLIVISKYCLFASISWTYSCSWGIKRRYIFFSHDLLSHYLDFVY